MATLDAPTMKQVYDRVNEEPVSYGFFTTDVSPVFSIIQNLELISTAAAMAENAADAACAPFDFPISEAVIAQRNPAFTPQQVTERYERQAGPFMRFMIDRAAADLVLSLKPDNTRLDQRTIEYRREALLQGANDSLKAGVAFVQKLLSGTSTEGTTTEASPPRTLTNVQLSRAD